MGLISRLVGGSGAVQALGAAAQNVAQVFVPNATRQMELSQEAYLAVLTAAGAEFAQARAGWFDGFVNGLNRLPRPMLALGTLGLFAYAMAAPDGFALRMQGLAFVPEPLWWLLGAVVSFYFGAREAHHFRMKRLPAAAAAARPVPRDDGLVSEENPALDAWRASDRD